MDHQHIPQQALYWEVSGFKRGPVGQEQTEEVLSRRTYKEWNSPRK